MNRKGVAVLAMMGIIWAATLVAYGVRKLVVCPPVVYNAQKVSRIITLPDNTTIVLPDNFSMKDFQCALDNTFCFDNNATSEFRWKRHGSSYFYLWRI